MKPISSLEVTARQLVMSNMKESGSLEAGMATRGLKQSVQSRIHPSDNIDQSIS